MNLRLLFVFFLLVSAFNPLAQTTIPDVVRDSQAVKFVQTFSSGLFKVNLCGTAGDDSITSDWVRTVVTFTEETEHEGPDPQLYFKLKNELNKRKFGTQSKTLKTEETTESNLLKPKIGTNFAANETTDGTPPDNTMAISNGGKIVTAINSNIQYYDIAGTKLYDKSFYDFLTANNAPDLTSLNGKLYDPVLIYDVQADRFIFILLHGSTSSVSKILICFSKTNNPQNGWYVYAIASRNYYVAKWIDFPRAAVSTNELFISGNVFSDNANIFSNSVVFQITKADGYAGKTSLNMFQWDKVLDARKKNAFSIVPVSGGHNSAYGPGIYMVSTINTGSDSVFLYKISNDLSHTPTLTCSAIIMTTYSMSGDAGQKGTTTNVLSNGDCRVLSGFYLNGIIHFVFHSKFNWQGNNGVNYVQLNTATKTIKSKIIGITNYDYSYPNIVSASAEGTNDQTAFIGFLMSGGNAFPQVKIVYADATLTPTSPTLIKDGEGYVNILKSEVIERWGDYTGMARKFNAVTPSCWFSGSYGTTTNSYKTYIAEIKDANVGIDDKDNSTPSEVIKVYPNPAVDLINIEFTLKTAKEINIKIIDVNGKTVKVLYQDYTEEGKTVLTFNKNALGNSVYFLLVSDGKNILKTVKIVN